MSTYRRALALTTASSIAVPLVGVASSPILAHALGVEGRGQAATALAPFLLLVGGATLGLPQSLTYSVARRAAQARTLLIWACGVLVPFVVLLVAAVWFASSYLAGGDPRLATLLTGVSALALPTLGVALLRGVAMGRERWGIVAAEKVLSSILRLVVLLVLLLLDSLTVLSAVLTVAGSQILAGLVYVNVLREAEQPHAGDDQAVKDLLRYGQRAWLGSIAVIVLGRSTDLLVTPLSGVTQMGLFVVAVTVSDTPYIVSQSLAGVVFASNSSTPDSAKVALISRLTLTATVCGAAVVGVTLPLWITSVFGAGFTGSIVPTWLLLGASCAAVPGLIAGAGLDSVGRAGSRSVILLLAVGVNLIMLLMLTPWFGAIGAASAGLITSTFSTVGVLIVARRSLSLRLRELLLPQGADVRLVTALLSSVVRRGRPTQSESDEPSSTAGDAPDGVEASADHRGR